MNNNLLWKLRLLVAIDFFAVAVLVPLLSSYFRDLGISTEKFGLMSSAYSLSQLVGGLLLGSLSDKMFSRRSILFLSFLGSGISYWLVGISRSFTLLLTSRIVVGLVKQTMTVCTAFLTDHFSVDDKPGHRTKQIGRLTACATAAFVVGPVLGSSLYSRHKLLPPCISACLFFLNCILVLVFLPKNDPKLLKNESNLHRNSGNISVKGRLAKFKNDFKITCALKPCLTVISAKFIVGFLHFSMDRSMVVGYYEDRWQIETYMLGYMRSYSTLLMLIAQVYLVGTITRTTSESKLIGASLVLIAFASFIESTNINIHSYLIIALPLRIVSHGLLSTSLQSLFTMRMPPQNIGAALGSMGVLQSASGVIAPLYGGALFQRISILNRASVAGCHYLAAAAFWVTVELWASKDIDSSSKITDKENADINSGEEITDKAKKVYNHDKFD